MKLKKVTTDKEKPGKFSKYGDVSVFRFYSDVDDLTISANKDIMQQKDAIVNDMRQFGYDLYAINSDGDYIILEFKRN